MTVQTVPYALQNASHSAALFRQSSAAAYANGGIISTGELAVSQQSTPNMSLILGPGRAKITGTSVSAPAGMPFTTQGMYDVLNDANVTLTVSPSNATNPRIDALYMQVQDSFYSGASNIAIAGIVSGVPAPTPAAPAVPSDSFLIALIAVAANVTTIVSANVTQVLDMATLNTRGNGAIFHVSTPAAMSALVTTNAAVVNDLAILSGLSGVDYGSTWQWVPGVGWAQPYDITFVNGIVSANAWIAWLNYAPWLALGASAVNKANGLPMHYSPALGGFRYVSGVIGVQPTSVVGSGVSANAAGTVSLVGATSIDLRGLFTSEFDTYMIELDVVFSTGAGFITGQLTAAGVPYTTANQRQFIQSISSATPTITYNMTAANVLLGHTNGSGGGYSSIKIANPYLQREKILQIAGGDSSGSQIGSGSIPSSLSYDGLLITTAIPITGSIRVYGINALIQ